jgi:hypothetical protein
VLLDVMKRMDTLAAAATFAVAVGNQELEGHLAQATSISGSASLMCVCAACRCC